MTRLLGWRDEVGPRREAARGFVPQLEALDGRVMPSVFGKSIKGDYTVASGPDVPAQVRDVSPPAAVLLTASDAAAGPVGVVHLAADGDGLFDPIGVPGDGPVDYARVGKATPHLF